MSTKKSNKSSIEYSIKRLEEIVDLMEQGDVTLDEAIDLYEEGIRISKECAEKLKNAELRIKKLTKDLDGQFRLNEVGE